MTIEEALLAEDGLTPLAEDVLTPLAEDVLAVPFDATALFEQYEDEVHVPAQAANDDMYDNLYPSIA